MPQVIGPVDHGSALDVAIVPRTAQVFAYRLWVRQGASAWRLLGEGSTANAGAHAFSTAAVDGLQIYHWIGVGGEPNAPFECVIACSQSHPTRAFEPVIVRGQLDATGVAAAQDWVNVQ